MKRQVKWMLLGLLLAAFVAASSPVATAQGPVTLEVFDPTGAIEVSQLFTARLADLNGKTICEASNGSWESDRTFPVIRQLLQKQFPTAKIITFDKFTAVSGGGADVPTLGDEMKKQGCQAAIVGNAG
jgi:ABC-type amino acid transport substrate-binding protein